MDRACVIGWGVVGQATGNLFGIKQHFDIDPMRSNISLEQAAKCEMIFICLPTEVKDDGSYDISPIWETVKQIEEYGTGAIYVIRSTVWPGFAMHLQKELGMSRVVSNPEFLSEDTAEKDTQYPPFVLIGSLGGSYLEKVKGIYLGRIRGVKIIETDNTTAEMAKMVLNAFFAMKVIFANEVFEFAKERNADYGIIKKIIENHPFGSKNHFTIWYKGKRGVNGRCLPKDTKALAHYSGMRLTSKVMELNEEYTRLKEEKNEKS